MAITKNIIRSLILFGSIFMFGCKDADEIVDRLTHFTFDTDYVVTVPPSAFVNIPVSIQTPDISTTSNQEFGNNKTRGDMVESARLTALTLEVQTPSGGSLSFLKSVDIRAVADGLPEIQVAYKTDVPVSVGGFLSLDVTNAELAEYFRKEKYALKITVVADEAVTVEYKIKSVATFFVDAKILGQ